MTYYSPNSALRDRSAYTLRMHLERILMLSLAVLLVSSFFSSMELLGGVSNLIELVTSGSFDADDILELFEDSFESGSSSSYNSYSSYGSYGNGRYGGSSYNSRSYSSSSNFDIGEIISDALEGLSFDFTIPTLLSGLSSVVGAVLNTGYLYALILLASGTAVKASVLICRWKHVLGIIGVQLWVSAKTFFWALPGIGVMIFGASISSASVVGAVSSASSRSSADANPSFGMIFGGLVMIAGLITILVLVIPAALRFAMTPYIFADTPELGVYDAVERSKEMMAYRKVQLFCLTIPYILGIFGIILGLFLLFLLLAAISPALLTALALVLLIAAVIGCYYLSMLSQVAVAHFYVDNKARLTAAGA